MDFIFTPDPSIIPGGLGGTHVNSVSFMVSAACRADSVGPLRMCPSASVREPPVCGRPLCARPAREWISGDNLVEGNRKSTPLQSRRLCTLECRVEFPLLSIYMALSLCQQPPVLELRPRQHVVLRYLMNSTLTPLRVAQYVCNAADTRAFYMLPFAQAGESRLLTLIVN